MLANFLGRYSRHVVSETMNALDALDWSGGSVPTVWAYPTSFEGNPFQRLLYRRMLDHNILIAPTNTIEATLELQKRLPSQVPLVVHLSWLHLVLKGSANEAEGKAAIKEYFAGLDKLKANGAKIVWTVHNVLPHDSRLHDLEDSLNQGVYDRADLVHIMSPRTPEMCQPWFPLDSQKLWHVNHPSYHGVYPSWQTKAMARRMLNIRESDLVFVLFGAIKPYKGLDDLAAAFDRLCLEVSAKLVIAGETDSSPATREFLAWASTHPSVILQDGKVHPNEIQNYLRCADVAVLPYKRILNSGWLKLALTFSLPVVTTADSGLVPILNDEVAEIYDAAQPDGLYEALKRSSRLTSMAAVQAASDLADSFHVDKISEEFASQAQAWVQTWVNDK